MCIRQYFTPPNISRVQYITNICYISPMFLTYHNKNATWSIEHYTYKHISNVVYTVDGGIPWSHLQTSAIKQVSIKRSQKSTLYSWDNRSWWFQNNCSLYQTFWSMGTYTVHNNTPAIKDYVSYTINAKWSPACHKIVSIIIISTLYNILYGEIAM